MSLRGTNYVFVIHITSFIYSIDIVMECTLCKKRNA
jgi:hypothetical protein